MAQKKLIVTEEDSVKESFFRHRHCAHCGSIGMLELDRVNPLAYPPQDIWEWDEWRREKFFKDELQVLCNPCLLRKKRLWRKYREENAWWYQEFVKNG